MGKEIYFIYNVCVHQLKHRYMHGGQVGMSRFLLYDFHISSWDRVYHWTWNSDDSQKAIVTSCFH